MTIEHVAVYARDLEALRAFYENYFVGKSNHGYHNPRTGLRTYFLSFGGGARLELMNRPGVEPSSGIALREGWAHISFRLGSPEAVDQLTERLRTDGYTVESGPRTTGDGYYESCVLDPEGNRVELVG